MRLEGYYYKVESVERDGDCSVFTLSLLKDCSVYRGHFPSRPVCPGAFGIRLIKECAEKVVGRPLHFREIRRCRLPALATPAACPLLTVTLGLAATGEDYETTATVADASATYIELKGSLTKRQSL